MSVNFSPTNWVDNSQPAITAAQLNRMERGILDCANAYNKIPSVYKYKGTLQDVSNLPMDNNEVGDVYNILNSGDNYSWNGESWEFLNISINITPFTEDYILERGTKEVDGVTWTYEKWNSGTFKMWGTVTATYVDPSLLIKQSINFPVELVENAIGFATVNEFLPSSRNSTKTPTILCKTNRCTVQVHDHFGTFTQDTTLNVAVQVIGKWRSIHHPTEK